MVHLLKKNHKKLIEAKSEEKQIPKQETKDYCLFHIAIPKNRNWPEDIVEQSSKLFQHWGF